MEANHGRQPTKRLMQATFSLFLTIIIIVTIAVYHSGRTTPFISGNSDTWKIYVEDNSGKKSTPRVHHTKNLPSTNYHLTAETSNSNLITRNSSTTTTSTNKIERMKIIYQVTDTFFSIELLSDFSNCKYKNCLVEKRTNLDDLHDADLVTFLFNKIKGFPRVTAEERQNQLWLIYGVESPGYSGNQWKPNINNQFNLTMTYRTDSDIPFLYGRAFKKPESTKSDVDYSKGKTKGAFAYVSNCYTVGYDRLKTMQRLGKYIDVDIFGSCTRKFPCKRRDYDCETRLHSQYRFFLSFENSLCKEYITQKFWARLASSSYFVPVAVGGLTLDEYTSAAPPNSFIHLYNFTSIEALGVHLKHLVADNDAYNSYHVWRDTYDVSIERPMCDLCEFANTKPKKSAYSNLSGWWNDHNCRKL